MKQHAIKQAALCGSALFLVAGTSLAGEPMPYIAPPPAPADCSGCINPGFYVEGSLLYLNSYASESEGGYDGEWDFGFRGTLGWENADGLFVELTGFYYEGDWDYDNDQSSSDFDGEIEVSSIDLIVGDTIHCGEACLSVAAGLRYADLEVSDKRDFTLKGTDNLNTFENTFEFDGWGPVIKIEGTRALTEQFELYAEITQALLFGEADYKTKRGGTTTSSRDSDTLASVTEIGLGVQYNFGIGLVQNAFIRLGLEGQYWLVDSTDVGLFGGVLKIGGRF